MKEECDKLGIIFTDTVQPLRHQNSSEYFSKLVPPTDNKFAALNSAFWSVVPLSYVLKALRWIFHKPTSVSITEATALGVYLSSLMKGALVHYVEGCTALTYTTASLHAAIVEILRLMVPTCATQLSKNWSDKRLQLGI